MRRFPSYAAFLFVLVAVGISFFWWIQNKPSYLLFQAHKRMGQGDQAAVIAEYTRLLENKDLSLSDQIRFRKALGEFYLRAIQENTSFSLYLRDDYSVGHTMLEAAKKEFKTILALEPKDGFSHYALGQILLWEKLENFALEELELSVKYMPDSPEPLRVLSLIYQGRGDATKGLEFALRSVAVNPGYDQGRMALVSAYSLLGDFYSVQEQYEKLSSSFRSLPDIRSTYAYFLVQHGDWEKGLQEISYALSLAPHNGEVRLYYGRILLEMGRFDEASAQIAQAAEYSPHSISPFVWHVEALSGRGKCEDAARYSQLLVEGFPRWGWSHLAHARSLFCRNRTNLGLGELEEALRLTPGFQQAMELKARILLDKGQYEELGAFIRPRLDEKQNEAQGYLYLAESFFRQSEIDLAEEMAEASIKRNQRNGMAFAWLGLSRFEKGDKEGAKRAFANAVSLNPLNMQVIAWADFFYSLESGPPGREEALDNLVRKNPYDPTIAYLSGEVYLKNKKYAEAVRSFQKSIELKPYLLMAQVGLLKSYWALGDAEKADSVLADAMEINSRNKEVLFWRSKIRGQK